VAAKCTRVSSLRELDRLVQLSPLFRVIHSVQMLDAHTVGAGELESTSPHAHHVEPVSPPVHPTTCYILVVVMSWVAHSRSRLTDLALHFISVFLHTNVVECREAIDTGLPHVHMRHPSRSALECMRATRLHIYSSRETIQSSIDFARSEGWELGWVNGVSGYQQSY
jgi:hypothetical protein